MDSSKFYVIKRNGVKEPISFDKITERYISLSQDIEPKLDPQNVNPIVVAQKVVQGVFTGVKTSELDNLAAETAAHMSTIHPDYALLAARISFSNLQKEAPKTFFDAMTQSRNNKNQKNGLPAPLIAEDVFDIITRNKQVLEDAIQHKRDFGYDYFGFKTLERSYLARVNGKIVETPQYMLMRVSIGIHKEDIESVIETYNLLSLKFFTHATPTLFNSGTMTPQMSSCYLLCMKEDSIDGIYDTLKRCALISKSAGGIGLSIHCIRATNSYIRGTNGNSNGLVPMLRVFNDTARYVDQGGGKRKGAFAVYLEPWHADIYDFLELRKNTGKEEQRARDLFFALWIPDLFMRRVEQNEDWSLFCPNEAQGLHKTWGKEFEDLYQKYENTPKLARRVIRAQDLWFAIMESQIETGGPYMMYKDACNSKSNQKNLGTIQSSNLCTEIVQYSSPDEVAVCNLASIALPMFVGYGKFDHKKLYIVTIVATKNLNKIIDGNYYPIEEARRSNLKHRPIGLGVQGLADVFIKMRLPWDSEGAAILNREIFETIYFAALTASKDLAKEYGTYESYDGSPVSKGILQFDMWNVTPSDRWDWQGLREEISKHGVRNSLLVAPMPTASTSQILGNTEGCEALTSNIYNRRVLAGEFAVVNRELVNDLSKLGLWTTEIKNRIIANNGSVQAIPEVPLEIKNLYKTVWEISQRRLIDLAADRAAFIDQSQSFNVFIAKPNYQNLSSMHFYGWSKGLKTGCYYLRSRPAADAIKVTIDQSLLTASLCPENSEKDSNVQDNNTENNSIEEGEVCRMEEGCVVCGS